MIIHMVNTMIHIMVHQTILIVLMTPMDTTTIHTPPMTTHTMIIMIIHILP